MAASLVSLEWYLEQSSKANIKASAECGSELLMNISHAFCVAVVADRTVSVRPFLNAAVLQDSYVATVLPYCL